MRSDCPSGTRSFGIRAPLLDRSPKRVPGGVRCRRPRV
jgi:hypothetical protein